jgi:hypothetical protein
MDKDRIIKLYKKIKQYEQFDPEVIYAKYKPLASSQELRKKRLYKLARAIHAEDFGEEYDFMYDSVFDKVDRSNGTSPMSQEYIDKYTKKRESLGVEPLSENGISIDGISGKSSFNISLAQAKSVVFNII